MQKCDFNFVEITLMHGHSSVNIRHICNRAYIIFRKHIWGTASSHRSKSRNYKCRGSF